MRRNFVGHEFEFCTALKIVGKSRNKDEKNYMCQCRLCKRLFIRSQKALLTSYTHCGCALNLNLINVKQYDYEIRHLDRLSLDMLKLKIDVLNDFPLSQTFRALYISGKPLHEYTAISNYMSFITLKRARYRIIRIWERERNKNIPLPKCIEDIKLPYGEKFRN